MTRYARLAPDGTAEVNAASRVVRYVFSDESIGRDGHIVKADAWRTENFEANPVFLWQHLDEEPPIGRVFDLHTANRTLCGSVKYAETAFAETIFALVRGGFLNATSTSWSPIEYQQMGHSTGRGYIFTDVDLLEISQVCVPALPTALAQAGARGVNVKPLATWAERALDSGRRGGLDRRDVRAIYRACAGSTTVSIGSPPGGRAARLERARWLKLVEEDRRLFDRYEVMRSTYGLDIETAARSLLVPAQRLREAIARRLAAG
jgi:phage head maturation protease